MSQLTNDEWCRSLERLYYRLVRETKDLHNNGSVEVDHSVLIQVPPSLRPKGEDPSHRKWLFINRYLGILPSYRDNSTNTKKIYDLVNSVGAISAGFSKQNLVWTIENPSSRDPQKRFRLESQLTRGMNLNLSARIVPLSRGTQDFWAPFAEAREMGDVLRRSVVLGRYDIGTVGLFCTALPEDPWVHVVNFLEYVVDDSFVPRSYLKAMSAQGAVSLEGDDLDSLRMAGVAIPTYAEPTEAMQSRRVLDGQWSDVPVLSEESRSFWERNFSMAMYRQLPDSDKEPFEGYEGLRSESSAELDSAREFTKRLLTLTEERRLRGTSSRDTVTGTGTSSVRCEQELHWSRAIHECCVRWLDDASEYVSQWVLAGAAMIPLPMDGNGVAKTLIVRRDIVQIEPPGPEYENAKRYIEHHQLGDMRDERDTRWLLPDSIYLMRAQPRFSWFFEVVTPLVTFEHGSVREVDEHILTEQMVRRREGHLNYKVVLRIRYPMDPKTYIVDMEAHPTWFFITFTDYLVRDRDIPEWFRSKVAAEGALATGIDSLPRLKLATFSTTGENGTFQVPDAASTTATARTGPATTATRSGSTASTSPNDITVPESTEQSTQGSLRTKKKNVARKAAKLREQAEIASTEIAKESDVQDAQPVTLSPEPTDLERDSILLNRLTLSPSGTSITSDADAKSVTSTAAETFDNSSENGSLGTSTKHGKKVKKQSPRPQGMDLNAPN